MKELRKPDAFHAEFSTAWVRDGGGCLVFCVVVCAFLMSSLKHLLPGHDACQQFLGFLAILGAGCALEATVCRAYRRRMNKSRDWVRSVLSDQGCSGAKLWSVQCQDSLNLMHVHLVFRRDRERGSETHVPLLPTEFVANIKRGLVDGYAVFATEDEAKIVARTICREGGARCLNAHEVQVFFDMGILSTPVEGHVVEFDREETQSFLHFLSIHTHSAIYYESQTFRPICERLTKELFEQYNLKPPFDIEEVFDHEFDEEDRRVEETNEHRLDVRAIANDKTTVPWAEFRAYEATCNNV